MRGWVLALARDYGLNIVGVSFDGFDSRETIQVLRKSGIWSDVVSVDTSTAPYEAVRDMLYEDRLDIQHDAELVINELRTVEYYADQDKIDHPPRGTKDAADGVAGAVWQALKSRRLRRVPSAIESEWHDGVDPDQDMTRVQDVDGAPLIQLPEHARASVANSRPNGLSHAGERYAMTDPRHMAPGQVGQSQENSGLVIVDGDQAGQGVRHEGPKRFKRKNFRRK